MIAAVAVLAAGTLAFRVAGPVLRERFTVPPAVERYTAAGAVVLLVALVATAALLDGHQFAGWARPAGVLTAALLAWRRVPFAVVVCAAAAVTAGLRLAGVG